MDIPEVMMQDAVRSFRGIGGIEMSVVMFGGNKCMERRYLDTCKEYGYKAKVFNRMTGTSLKRQVAPRI